MSKPYVFTIQTKEALGYFRLLESARKWGWPLETVWAEDLDPGNFEESYHAFIAEKHLLIRQELLRTGVDQFFFLDAWDTVFTGPFEELTFHPMELYFSCANDCYPEKGYERLFTNGTYPYPNTGVIWGSATKYRYSCPNQQVLDQLAWTREIAVHPSRYCLDTEYQVACTIFHEDTSNWARKDGRWIWQPTGTRPLVVHAAGKQPMPAFLYE